MADSIGTCVGAVLGTSTTTTFVESASGVTEGGRTGLTAMTPACCSCWLPSSAAVPHHPSFATAPALIIVGFYMMGSAIKIDFSDPSEGIPAFLAILRCPLPTASLRHRHRRHLLDHHQCGHRKAKEKKISPSCMC